MSERDVSRGEVLLAQARHALVEAVGGVAVAPPEPSGETRRWLSQTGATFVTLRRQGELRGCLGCLEPSRSLLDDVRHNARAAALEDRRFEPVAIDELADLALEVSVLSPLEEIACADQAELLVTLRPGVDGVVLECRGRARNVLAASLGEFARSGSVCGAAQAQGRPAGAILVRRASSLALHRREVRRVGALARYSARSASTGSRRAARRAGTTPEASPVARLTATAAIANSGGV